MIINNLQQCEIDGRKPFRIALVTARGGDARERVLRTFDAWGLSVDESHFLSGFPKAGILKAFRPHIFFDDQDAHVGPASEVVPSGRVPWANPLEDEGPATRDEPEKDASGAWTVPPGYGHGRCSGCGHNYYEDRPAKLVDGKQPDFGQCQWCIDEAKVA
jgi:hypothetical protein